MARRHLATLVEDFRRHGDQTAVVLHAGNRRLPTTYGGLAVLAGRFAAELDARGIGSGERVVLWGENSAEWVAAFFGCMLRGVLAVPLDASGSVSFAERVIADVSPQLIAGTPTLLRTIAVETPFLAFPDFERLLPRQPSYAVSSTVSPETPFQIVFTSGTTSAPKGIVHTHRNVLASLGPIELEIGKYRKYERIFHPLRFHHTLPLSHVFGQFMGLWVPALLAAEVHFYSQTEPARIVAAIREERISVLVAVPGVLQLLRTYLLKRFPSLDQEIAASQGLPAWKRWWRFRRVHRIFGLKFWAAICGGASLPSELEQFWNGLGFALIQGYGMTETAALVTLNHPFKIARGTIGKALPGRDIRLRDGEILVRGDMLSPATWQDGRLHPREEEWLATGDLAEEDTGGSLRFTGRRGDVIVLPSGMNIHPADLETVLAQQPGVSGCVVVPCAVSGAAEPVAVVLSLGSDSELKAAVANANAQLASHQRMRHFLRWPGPGFPHTSTGKLLRREVAQWACDSLREQSAGQQQHADWLLAAIAEVTAEAVPGGEDGRRLTEDFHLDSLGRVQLQSVLEQRLGVELADDALLQIETLGQLRALVNDSLGGAGKPDPAALRPDSPGGAIPAQNRREVEAQTGPSAPRHTYPHWPWTWPVYAIRVLFIELALRPLVWFLAAPRVVRDPDPLPQGPFLLIANHVTAYDGALVLYALPGKLRRRVAVAMSGEMLLDFREGRNQGSWLLNQLSPIAYWLLSALFNTFPLPRRQGFRASFLHAGAALDGGYSVLIFPEGHRSDDGRLQPFRSGIGLLARESQAPLLPIALIGLGDLKTSRRWFRTGRLTVRVGKTIAVDESLSPAESASMLEEVLRRLTT